MTFRTLLMLGAGLLLAPPAGAATLLYEQDFESPNAFNDAGGNVDIDSVQSNYGGQPPGFAFGQTFTVETLLVEGGVAWGTGFLDPQGIAGNHVIAMLATAQDDRLGLSFDVGPFDFLNFRMDISPIDLDRWGGPFNNAGIAPNFAFTLFDNPSGAVGIGGGTVLDSCEVTGDAPDNQWTFNWTEALCGLDASASTNGNVTLQIDLLAGGYAAMDNFRIAASDIEGELPVTTPEPGTVALLGMGLLGLALRRRG
jgi:hypothetical protein